MKPTQFGILIGVLLGMTWALGSFGDMLVAAFVAAVGFVIAKVLEGELEDLTDFVNQRQVARRR